MEKMMKPAEYAKELGISRQAVYAKIKRGILTARNVDGKLYIVLDNEEEVKSEELIPPSSVTPQETVPQRETLMDTEKQEIQEYQALLDAKDETISVLKGTVKDLKKSNKQISSTLRGEIDLLKEAFHEMRTLYRKQLEQKHPEMITHEANEAIEIVEDEIAPPYESQEWISLKKFFQQQGIVKEKQQIKIEKKVKKAYDAGDKRIKNKKGKWKLTMQDNYKDFIEK